MPYSAPMFRAGGGWPDQTADLAMAPRPSARQRGYTHAWDISAKSYLADHPLCVGCQARGVTRAAELVDHVVPHKGNLVLFWDPGNWQASCRFDHDQVKQRLEAMFVAGELAEADLRLDSEAARAIAAQLGDG